MAHLRDSFLVHDIRYVGRFLAVGMLGTLIDLTLFAGLHAWLGVPTLAANTISYSTGIINNFGLHRHWTFADRVRQATGAQFSRFAVVSLSALMLNNLLVLLLAPSFGALFPHAGYGDLAAKVCATGVGLGWNFLINNLWTFRDVAPELQARCRSNPEMIIVEVNAHDERMKN
jgi:putative flippase GtrA